MNRHSILLGAVCGALLVFTTATAYAQPRDPAEAAAEAAAHKTAPATAVTPATNFQAPASTSLCFTCGGDWPVYAGTIPTPSAANERTGGCFGGFTTGLNDHFPFLCAR
jgi:hypothetical protein